MEFINLTPHDITIMKQNEVIMKIPSKGIARVKQKEEVIDEIDGIPIVKAIYGAIEGLPPEPEPNTYYIVSKFIVDALKASKDWEKWDGHILIPNSGPTPNGAVRDEKGRIVGVRSLIRP